MAQVSEEKKSDERQGRARRYVRGVALVLLVLGLGNVVRLVMALRYASSLPDLPLTVSWEYLAVTGGVWGVAFTVGSIGLFLLRSWGRWLALVTVLVYQVHMWGHRILFDANAYARQVWPRDLALTLLLLLLVWGGLNLSSVCRLFQCEFCTSRCQEDAQGDAR